MRVLVPLTIMLLLAVAYAVPNMVQKGEFKSLKTIPYHPGFDLPDMENTLFATSGTCEMCHGAGSLGPLTNANTDPDGNDISPVSLWQATMMANSSKDPFWQAKVSHEKLVNPSLSGAIEETCLRCHAPLGKFNAMHHSLPYSLDSLKTDPIGLDGVSCLACHAMEADGLGSVFSANMTYDTMHTVFGQYSDPVTGPMTTMIGFTPTLGEHVSSAAACGACHTLITSPVDETGVSLDTFFVEQAMYHEWKNSSYSDEGVTCQSCHMPKVDYNVFIANRPPWLSSRNNYSKHDLVGANAFMLNLLGNNIDTLGLTASSSDFEETISRTMTMLQTQTANLDLGIEQETADSVTYYVDIENLAGHKFPSGYPSRRAIVEFIVQSPSGDTLFHSGEFDDNFYLTQEDATYEPHYDTIKSEDNVQIYELVMGDYNGDVTTVLEYAYTPLKDNRLVPEGFSTTHESYDTTQIIGNAQMDLNFNESENGRDVVFYKIPKDAEYGSWVITAKLLYQSVPPKWLEEMFDYSSEEIDLFEYLYFESDLTPMLVAMDRIGGFQSVDLMENDITIYPNPSSGPVIINAGVKMDSVQIFNASGQLLVNQRVISNQFIWDAKVEKGVYLIQISTSDKKNIVRKVIIQ